jgi:hypothetical protein
MNDDASFINSLVGPEKQKNHTGGFIGNGIETQGIEVPDHIETVGEDIEKITGLGPNTQETISTIESAEGIGSAENPDNLDPKEVVNTIGNIQKTSVKTIVDTEEPTKYFENTPVTGTSDHMKADAEEAIFIENQMREAAHGSK